MQWLNKLDDSLDRVFLRPPQTPNASSHGGDDNCASVSDDGDVSSDSNAGTRAGDDDDANQKPALEGVILFSRGKIIDEIIENDVKGTQLVQSTHDKRVIHTTESPRKVPPPPPLPRPQTTSIPSATIATSTTQSKIRAKTSSAAPITTNSVALTPIEKTAAIMSTSGEFLADFINELPAVSSVVTNANMSKECNDGNHCQPLESIFMKESSHDADNQSSMVEQQTPLVPQTHQLQQQQHQQQQSEKSDFRSNYFELRDNEIDKLNHDGNGNNCDRGNRQRNVLPPPPFPPPQQQIEQNHNTQSEHAGQKLNAQQETKHAAQPLHLQNQETPSAFIVHLPLHSGPNSVINNNPVDRLTNSATIPPPPPPSLPTHQSTQPSSVPPSPLPNNTNDNRNVNDSWQPSTPLSKYNFTHPTQQHSHPHPRGHSHIRSTVANPTNIAVQPQHQQHRAPSSLSSSSPLTLSPRTITTPRATPRATPGVIRSRIRAPSISPPISRSESLEESSPPLAPTAAGGGNGGHVVNDAAEAVDRSNSTVKAKGITSATLDRKVLDTDATHHHQNVFHIPPPPLVNGNESGIGSFTSRDKPLDRAPTAETIQRGQPIDRDGQSNNEKEDSDSDAGHNIGDGDTVGNVDGDDVDDDSSSATSFHSQVSNASELTDDDNNGEESEDDREDYILPSHRPLIAISDDRSWDPSFNCYGIVHVRMLRAQRLPCIPGTSINASLSLPPWKGRIRIPGRVAVDGPEGAGVCLRWDKPLRGKRGGGSKKEEDGSKNDESPPSAGALEDPCSHSMVHAYNNEDTPIPTVSLELSTSALGGVFEKFLCSASFPCHELLRSPGMWNRRWCPATFPHETAFTVPSSSATNKLSNPQADGDESENENRPWILLEICFEPKVEDSEPTISHDSDTLGSIPRDFVIKSNLGGSSRDARNMPENIYSSVDDESISKTSTLTTAFASRNPVSKSHLLRVRSFWVPAWCAVCSKVLVTRNFECEACHIFCCRDCQLQVDVRIPCGSELSKVAVKKAQQYQVSISQIMTTLAPHSVGTTSVEGVGAQIRQLVGSPNVDVLARGETKSSKIEGIGMLNIRVLNACLFDKTFAPDAEPSELFEKDSSNLRNGDHYCRISWLGSKDSRRTKTVLQASKPVFDSEEMSFDVPHYGMEYKLEVVDANTDKPVGACLLSAQGLLQWQRDARIQQGLLSILNFRHDSEPRRLKLELRTGVKDAFGLNFYNATKLSEETKEKNLSARAGEISGWVEIDVHLDEDKALFYSSNPRQCPPRATEEFDIALIQLHIARIGAIVEDIQKIISTYLFVVSWENRTLTGVSMIIFVVLTLQLNLEYLGSIPIGTLVIYMVYLGNLRLNGHFKDRWLTKEKDTLVESETKIEKNHSIQRTVGILQVSELRGKNLRSRELGLPGSFYASIFYDPVRYASEKMKSSLSKHDESSSYTHEIATTVSPGITSNPIWEQMRSSTELTRLKNLLPNDHLWGEQDDHSASVQYPILQPIVKDVSFETEENDDAKYGGLQLMPWESSFGAVVVQVRFSDVLGSFQMFDNLLGEVVVPLAKLASGREVEGWFRLLGVGTTETVPGQSSDDEPRTPAEGNDSDGTDDEVHLSDFPELYVKVKFSPNIINKETASSSDMESSKVICEEMVRTASMSKDSSIGMIGSSISTLNTVRSLGGNLQNQISYVVDTIERVRNAFNFSNPRITSVILICLSLLWRVLATVPTRIVILFAGLAQFGVTFYTEFVAQSIPKAPKEKTEEEEAEETESATGNIFENLFLSIPTDEDLRRTYFWEARRLGEREREKFAITKRQTRLEKLWKAQWHGTLKIKEKKAGSEYKTKRNWSWEEIFALIEGHRFIWWRSEKHFDTGEAPLGQIFFAGHSGLAGLSPLDLRELTKEEIPYIVSIFGRGFNEQKKISLMASSSDLKESLEDAVLAASMDVKAD